MKMKSLMSAAHAAGYAMAAEEVTADDVAQPRPQPVVPHPKSTALTVRPIQYHATTSLLLRAPRLLRRYSLREWLGAYWTGRAAA